MVMIVFAFIFLISSSASARELAYLITYGTDAGTIEGDDDYTQVVFIKIPSGTTQPVYVRIFDADCGGEHDERYSGRWNTRTRFRLFGGKGAFTEPGLKKFIPSAQALGSGKVLADEEFGVDEFRDNQWYTFSEVDPRAGEEVGDFRYFRVVVEGMPGDDGNAFLIAATKNPHQNTIPEDFELFTLKPTIRLPRTGVFSEMRFFVPRDVTLITVHNFDLSGAKIGVDTAFRTNIPVPTSGQNQWVKGSVILKPNEIDRICALRFEGGREMPNDGSFYVTDSMGNLLPIKLTVYLQTPNFRPDPKIDIRELSDCRSFIFDASRTTDKEGDALKFFWDFGDGGKGEGIPVTHKYDGPGKYRANIIIEDNSGQIFNSVMKEFSVTVNQGPVADAGEDLPAAPREVLSFSGSKSYDPDGRLVKYLWDFGDGTRASGINVKHSYKTPDEYTVTLRVRDNSRSPCNVSSDQCLVKVNAAPRVEIGKNIVASANESIELSGANSGDSDGEITTYKWNLGDMTIKSGQDILHAYEKPGKYKVTLTVIDNSGASNSATSDSLLVYINHPPKAEAGANRKGSTRKKIVFNPKGSSDRDGRLVEYQWDFGDGSSPVVTQKPKPVAHQYKQPGSYQVTLRVRDNSGTSSSYGKDTALVFINHPPIANAGPDQLGTRGEVTFDASASRDPDGKIIRYRWAFGDGESATGVSTTHLYRNPGQYKVRLTVTDDSKTSTRRSTDEMMVSVNHFPVADAGPDIIGIPGQTVKFSGLTSIDPDGEITQFLWDFGDGNTGTGRQTTHQYSKPGKYNALLTVRDNSGFQEAVGYDEVTVWINRSPVAVAGPDLTIAPNVKITFNGDKSYDPDGKIVSFQWDFSDGKHSSKQKRVSRTFRSPGVYTAHLTVVDNHRVTNSTVQDKMTIRVNHPPRADCGKNILTSKRTVLLDGSASTDADGDLLTYEWNFGDGSPVVKGERVFHTYFKAGNYPVTLTVDDGTGLQNARSSSSISVKINEAPRAIAGKNRTVCAGKPVIFDASGSTDAEGGLMKYKWDFGDGTTATGVNPVKNYPSGGVYMVKLTVMDDSGLVEGNTSTDQIAVTVVESPVADAGPDQSACAGTPVQFNGIKSRDVDGLVNNFRWDFGDGTMGGGPTPVHTYDKAGTYRVRLTISGDRIGTCNNTDTDETQVTIYEAPTAAFTCPQRVEKGKTILFNANGSGAGSANIVDYRWDMGDGSVKQGPAVRHAYPDSGSYIVALTVTTDTESDCNRTTKRKHVMVNESPRARAECSGLFRKEKNDYLVGVNQVVTLNAAKSLDPDGIISAYDWSFGDGRTGKGVHVRHQFKKPGKYKVRLKVTDNTRLSNNFARDSIDITVNEAPRAVITGGDIKACPGDKIVLLADNSTDPDGKIAHYTWNLGDGSPERKGVQIQHSYRTPGNYMVTLKVDDGANVSNSVNQTSTFILINTPPIAIAGPDRIISPGDQLAFNASRSRDRDGRIRKFSWDFGNGETREGVKTIYRFKQPGEYTVKLHVTDDSGSICASAEDSVNVRVNAPPVAVIKGDRESFFGGAHDAVFFDGTKSYDPDDDPLSFYWDFGDGENAKGPKVSHIFNKPGTYRVTLRVDDGNGLKSSTNSGRVTVRVRPRHR